ncbi:hypothetical protein N181_20115 [Sinorhizobium fredii USDA 205]|nr:hypothetical protein N181_20115 [Sinorhizobium fredii USDA 205]
MEQPRLSCLLVAAMEETSVMSWVPYFELTCGENLSTTSIGIEQRPCADHGPRGGLHAGSAESALNRRIIAATRLTFLYETYPF